MHDATGGRPHLETYAQELAMETLHTLLALPCAQQLPPRGVVSALTAAIEAQDFAAISRVVDELPSAHQIPADAAAAVLQRAAQHGYAVWKAVCGLPQLGQPQLTSEQMYVFLELSIALHHSEGLSELCHLAAEAEAAAAAAEGVCNGAAVRAAGSNMYVSVLPVQQALSVEDYPTLCRGSED
jgi:hypothetical protein